MNPSHKNHATSVALILLRTVATAPTQAGYLQLDLTSIVDSNLASYTNGGNYPGPGLVDIGGVDFLLADGGTGTTWVAGGLAGAGAARTYSIGGLSLANVTAMYAVINSAWGDCSASVGSIGAATGGCSASFDLIEGTNVRDHFAGSFCNVQTDAVATEPYGGGVLFDVYRFDLSGLTSGGADAITDFSFSSLGAYVEGEPFLAGLTFETVPAPATLALVSLDIFGLRRVRREG